MVEHSSKNQPFGPVSVKARPDKAVTPPDAVRVVAVPKATAAQQRQVRFLSEWEDQSERTLLDGDRVRSR